MAQGDGAAGSAADGADGRSAEPPRLSVHLYVNANTMAFAASIRPDPTALSDLVERLPDAAAAVLGWVPGLAVHEVGLAFDPTRGGAALYARAGTTDPAGQAAQVLLGTVSTGRARPFLVGLELDATIGLGSIPLFGEALSGISISDLSVSYAAAAIPEQAVPRPPSSPRHPGGFPQGPVLSMTVSDGANREELRLTPASKPKDPGPGAANLVPTAGDPPPVQWFTVGKRIGPLTIRRIGVITAGTAFGLALDASLRTTALSVDLAGFAVLFDPRSDISPRSLRIALEGLSVGFSAGSVRLEATLTRVALASPGVSRSGLALPPGAAESGGRAPGPGAAPAYEYAGTALVQAGQYSLSAVGAFAEIDGSPSLFVFGVVRGRFGGVPAFFITGVAAGFGYDRGLKLPSSTEILAFPLVRAALGGSRFAPAPPPGQTLAELRDGGWVPPLRGSYWLAAGIAFNSFGIVDGFILLLARFGVGLAFALLGVASIRLPKIGPTYAYVELTLDAVLEPLEGTFRASARLTPNSFVIDRNGRIEGGFAAALWFGAHPLAGDFAITLGGYHPAFDKPDWYPEVPRLALSWKASDALRIAGEAYFALSPSGVMAGGSLAMNFDAGALRAWFTAHTDFIMFWEPLFFEATVHVGIGASYTLALGTIRRTLTVELGADLAVWGPPFAGIAVVRWSVVSFTVTVNGGVRPPEPDRVIDWPSFEQAFLPAPSPDPQQGGDEAQSNVCRPRAAAGLLATILIGRTTFWLVSPVGFTLLTETAVPASRIIVEGPTEHSDIRFDGPSVGIYPMGSVPVSTVHRVRLEALVGDGRSGPPAAPGAPEDLTSWEWTPVTGNVPYAVWGTQNTGAPRLNGAVVPAMLGVLGTPRGAAPVGPGPVPVAALGIGEVTPRRPLPLPPGPPIDGHTTPLDIDSRLIVQDTVAECGPRDLRESVAAALSTAGIGSTLAAGGLALLADQVFTTLTAAPLIGPPGSTGPAAQEGDAADGDMAWAAVAPVAAVRPGGTRPVRPLPGGRTSGLSQVYYHAAGASAANGMPTSGAQVRAHLIDAKATNAQRRIAASHLLPGSGNGALRIAPGTTLAWRMPSATCAALDADGSAPLWIVAYDEQFCPVDIRLLPSGAAARYRVPAAAHLLTISALTSLATAADPPGAPADPGRAPQAGDPARAGWTRSTSLLHVAPQALLADGVIVRPQSPIPLRRSAADGTPGLLSGRELADRNRVRTAAGSRPGRLRVWLPAGTSTVTVTVRQAPDDLGVRGEPGDAVRLALVDASDRALEPPLRAVVLGSTGDEPSSARLRFTITPSITTDRESANNGWLCVSLRPGPGWLADGVLGDRPLDRARPAPGPNPDRSAAPRAFTEVVFT